MKVSVAFDDGVAALKIMLEPADASKVNAIRFSPSAKVKLVCCPTVSVPSELADDDCPVSAEEFAASENSASEDSARSLEIWASSEPEQAPRTKAEQAIIAPTRTRLRARSCVGPILPPDMIRRSASLSKKIMRAKSSPVAVPRS